MQDAAVLGMALEHFTNGLYDGLETCLPVGLRQRSLSAVEDGPILGIGLTCR